MLLEHSSSSAGTAANAQHPSHLLLLLAQLLAAVALLGIAATLLAHFAPSSSRLRLRFGAQQDMTVPIRELDPQMVECSRTCRIDLVESIAQNLTFPGDKSKLALPTFSVWMSLIREAKHSLAIAAYKSSLRGKHVLGEQQTGSGDVNSSANLSLQGEMVFDALLEAGLKRSLPIRMVENAVAKDKGDNEDGNSLYRRGALVKRTLNLQRIYRTGIMHSKFLLADGRHFYLGSANLDWRSLTQKMELGVYVRDCPCLSQDLATIFDIYWHAAEKKTATEVHQLVKKLPPARYNAQRPLKLMDGDHHRLAVHLSASPQAMNCPGRSWDLNDIVEAIQGARRRIYVNVMDYFPMFLYSQNRRYWPHIDNAIREAIMRGVQVRIIAAALHFPATGLRFLKSLEMLGQIPKAGSVAVKIFKVPTSLELKQQPVLRRDRRTHKKFLLTDDTLIIGTSNWSGDYFEDRGTGVAIVVRSRAANSNNGTAPLLERMRAMFMRDWESEYAHALDLYMEKCLHGENEEWDCEGEKDPNLLSTTTN